jgi:hypothetical protein
MAENLGPWFRKRVWLPVTKTGVGKHAKPQFPDPENGTRKNEFHVSPKFEGLKNAN